MASQTQVSRGLKAARRRFDASIKTARNLALLCMAGQGIKGRAKVNLILEASFLRAFVAWEGFLEEVFLRYLMGDQPARGKAPKRLYFPPSLAEAKGVLDPGNRRGFSEWTVPRDVIERANLFFKGGDPFSSAMRLVLGELEEMRIMRHAIAHASEKAENAFAKLARQKLGSLPLAMSPGTFLASNVPKLTPPRSFLEKYLDCLDYLVDALAPM